MVYRRTTEPPEDRTVIVREAPEMDRRLVAESDGRISIEQGRGKQVAQGLRFDADEIDELIAGLEELKEVINAE